MVRHAAAILALLTLLLASPARAVQLDGVKAKLPAPESTELAAKRREVIAIFNLGKARTLSQKRELLEQLLATAAETNDDPAGRFTLFDAACQLAARTGQLDEALDIVDQLESEFDYRGDALRVSAVKAAATATGVPTVARKMILARGFELIDHCVDRDAFAEAVAAATVMTDLARKVRDRDAIAKLVEQRKSLKRMQTRFAEVASAMAALKADPMDPRANAAVGRFLALNKGDWNAGLKMMAKGDDAALREIAELELKPPSSPAEHFRLAEAWWSAAEAMTDAEKQRPYFARAATWYQKSQPGLAILSRAKAKRRVEELAARGIHPSDLTGNSASRLSDPLPLLNDGIRDARWTSPKPLDLLAWVELPRDQVRGHWRRDGFKLISPDEKLARVRLPVIPPD